VSSRLRSLRGELVAMVMSTSSWICPSAGEILHQVIGARCQWNSGVGHDLGPRFRY
jgi:hypothetical protein